jgi:hypothetical protein
MAENVSYDSAVVEEWPRVWILPSVYVQGPSGTGKDVGYATAR